ncbi:glycerol-3-phosphate dehydrogenase [uncultured Stenotrophomonas sp.]|uniref:glycerol-3-phosphate dehydrogenase n=1 Tax=uncultured Stenotrophomonas sp. TaxID=165438 RepID=UPI0028E3ED44|nr:glycerol-3-phosphate dehydrogenase [uncultured Stenotrophomonas sp.]
MDDIRDVLVVGGGINGVSIARDAAGRGWSVTLCEQDDLAAHTSSASTKLIHGGLRYLQFGQFALVRKALRERSVLQRLAPHLVTPTSFVLPHARHLRPAWMLRAGLWLYDHLADTGPAFPHTRRVDLRRDPRGALLQPRYRTAFSYADARVDDARLVVATAMDARERGAEIRVRTRCDQLIRHRDHWLAVLRQADGTVTRMRARAVVNATGPWAGNLLERAGMDAPIGLRLVQGSHIVVPRLYAHDSAYLLQQPDQRVVFVIPFDQDYSLIGTTDVDYEDDPARVRASPAEVLYLCASVNQWLRTPVHPEQVVWQFSGVRPLLADHHHDADRVTRDYRLHLDHQQALILSVLGGKLTTCRTLAEEAVDQLAAALGRGDPAWTANGPPLPGGDGGTVAMLLPALHAAYPQLPENLLQALARRHGTRAQVVLGEAQTVAQLGQHFGAGLNALEVDYLVEHEWVREPEDLLWRRTHVGLRLDGAQQQALADYLRVRTATAAALYPATPG